GLAQREHLGVRGRVAAQLALVRRGRYDLALVCDDAADRHVVMLGGAFGFAQRESHVVLVAREEARRHTPATSRRPSRRSAAWSARTTPNRSPALMPAAS